LGPGPRLIKQEFTGPRSHKGWETLRYTTKADTSSPRSVIHVITLNFANCGKSQCDLSAVQVKVYWLKYFISSQSQHLALSEDLHYLKI